MGACETKDRRAGHHHLHKDKKKKKNRTFVLILSQ